MQVVSEAVTAFTALALLLRSLPAAASEATAETGAAPGCGAAGRRRRFGRGPWKGAEGEEGEAFFFCAAGNVTSLSKRGVAATC